MKPASHPAQASTLAILGALANGIDPATGEVFPADHPIQRVDIVRALFTVAAALQAPEPAPTAAKPVNGRPKKAGEPWSADEDKALTAAFDQGVKTGALAKQHQRSRNAIHARLVKLGKIAPT